MSQRRYESYKDSGVEWLGDVPSHWQLPPLKYIVRLESGGTPSKANPEYWDGEVPWASAKDLKVDRLADTADHLTRLAVHDGGVVLHPKGTVLVVVRGMILAHTFPVVQGTVPMAINQDLKAVLPSRELSGDFLAWGLRGLAKETLARVDEAGHGTKVLRVETWTAMIFPLPPRTEQVAIAAYLDRETAKIDALIAEQERLIALLAEKRQAVISHAVTKGLDPTVEMKDSGVEWLGEVPAHWTVISIKWLTPVQRGASPRPIEDPKYFDDEGEYAWVRIADVSEANGFLRETTQRLSQLGSSLSVRLKPGDLFVSIAGTVGKPCITQINACIHDGFVYFPGLDLDPMFFYRLFEAGTCIAGLGKMGTQLNLNTDTIGTIRVAVPPATELGKILAYIEREIAQIDDLVAEAQSGVSLLQERRNAIISAAVTGQIDVRERIAAEV